MASSTGDRQRGSLEDYCAAERNLLAWIGTGLAMMGGGFVVARFGTFIRQIYLLHQAPCRTVSCAVAGFWQVAHHRGASRECVCGVAA